MRKSINTAASAAQGAFRAMHDDAGKAFQWTDAVPVHKSLLAQWIEGHPLCTAAELYAFAVAGERNPAPWRRIPRELRVAIEIFRASYLVVRRLDEDDGKALHVA